MDYILAAISTVGISSVKHLVGFATAATYNFTWGESFLYPALGGILGVAFFIFLSQSAQKLYKGIFPKRKKKKRVFTRFSRFIVRIKRRFGLAGIAFLTPWILTIPVGTMISCRLYKNKTQVFLYQTGSILLWSLLGSGIAQPIAALIH